jgi:hypothetical protein
MAVGAAERRKLAEMFGTGVADNIVGQLDQSLADNDKIYFGTGDDASIYYDGTNLQIDSQEVGSGGAQFTGSITTSDSLVLSNADEGGTGKLTIQTAREVVTLTGATTDTTIAIPSGAVLLGAQFAVNTAVTDSAGDDTWSAAYITGSTTSLTSAAAAALNTKVNALVVPEVASDATEIQFTPNGGNFTAGVIEVVAYYYSLTSLANA